MAKIDFRNDLVADTVLGMLINIADLSYIQYFNHTRELGDLVFSELVENFTALLSIRDYIWGTDESDGLDIDFPSSESADRINDLWDALDDEEAVYRAIDESEMYDFVTPHEGIGKEFSNGGFGGWVQHQHRLYREEGVSENTATHLINDKLNHVIGVIQTYGSNVIEAADDFAAQMVKDGAI